MNERLEESVTVVISDKQKISSDGGRTMITKMSVALREGSGKG